jgi:hypothetical protein
MTGSKLGESSFAAPYMSGVIARYLQRHPGSTRDQIVTALQNMNATYSGVQIPPPGGGTAMPVLVFNECP